MKKNGFIFSFLILISAIAFSANAEVLSVGASGATSLTDASGQKAEITQMNQIKVVEPVRRAGGVFNDGVLDTNFYTATLAANATAAVSGSVLTLATTTDSGSSAQVTTEGLARYIGASSNYLRVVARVGDTGKINNVRRICAANTASPTDGYCFQLSGTDFSIVTLSGGTPTTVPNGSFNGDGSKSGLSWPVTTIYHTFEIHYTARKVLFSIDDVPFHTITATDASITQTRHLRPYVSNINTGVGSVATLQVMGMTISQLGIPVTQAKVKHITGTNASIVLKYGPGSIHYINVNAGSNGNTITVYDDTACTTSANIIGIPTLSSQVTPFPFPFEADVKNGICVATSGTGLDITFSYE